MTECIRRRVDTVLLKVGKPSYLARKTLSSRYQGDGTTLPGLQADGCLSLLYEVPSSLYVTKETYMRFFNFAVHDLFDVQGYGVMGLKDYGVIVLRGYRYIKFSDFSKCFDNLHFY